MCVYNAGLKVDTRQEILTVVMMSYYENVCSCKRHTVVCRAFYFGDLLCSFLASRLTTVSLDRKKEKQNHQFCTETIGMKYYKYLFDLMKETSCGAGICTRESSKLQI